MTEVVLVELVVNGPPLGIVKLAVVTVVPVVVDDGAPFVDVLAEGVGAPVVTSDVTFCIDVDAAGVGAPVTTVEVVPAIVGFGVIATVFAVVLQAIGVVMFTEGLLKVVDGAPAPTVVTTLL